MLDKNTLNFQFLIWTSPDWAHTVKMMMFFFFRSRCSRRRRRRLALRITQKRVTSGDKTENAWADFHICGFSTGLLLPHELTALGKERRRRLPDNDDGDFDGGEVFVPYLPSYPSLQSDGRIIARLKLGKTILVAETSRRR